MYDTYPALMYWPPLKALWIMVMSLSPESECHFSINDFGCHIVNIRSAVQRHVPRLHRLPVLMRTILYVDMATHTNECQHNINRALTIFDIEWFAIFRWCHHICLNSNFCWLVWEIWVVLNVSNGSNARELFWVWVGSGIGLLQLFEATKCPECFIWPGFHLKTRALEAWTFRSN